MTIVRTIVLLAALYSKGTPCLSGVVPKACQWTPGALDAYSTAKPGELQQSEHSLVPPSLQCREIIGIGDG